MFKVSQFYLENKINQSSPYLVHAGGVVDAEVKTLFSDIEYQFLSNHASKTEDLDLTVVTTTNFKTKGSLELSLDKLRFPKDKFFSLGNEVEDWQLHLKITLINEFLPQVKTKYILFGDSHDCMFLKLDSNIFNLIEGRMLLNCEPVFWPDIAAYNIAGNKLTPPESVVNQTFENTISSIPMYLNSGCWLATTDFAREVFSFMGKLDFFKYLFKHGGKLQTQDQHLFREAFFHYYPKMTLDYGSKFCQTLQRKKWSYEEGKYIIISNISEEIDYGTRVSRKR